jgi:hypothetical protein
MKNLIRYALVCATFITVATFAASSAYAQNSRTLFVTSAVENPDGTVTLPLHRGTSHGQTVYYVILDTSDKNLSQTLGVNYSQKLANAFNTAAAQKVSVINGVTDFPASVDFTPDHLLSVPSAFPPAVFQAGAVGQPGYSPLIQLPNGTIINAPQIARDQNGDGKITLLTEAADKVISIDTVNLTVVYRETNGFQGGKAVKYASFDSSDPLAAALEDVTYAPALNAAPTVDDDSTASSRASLAAFVNGQTGPGNPQRQGLNSAVLGDGDPLNVLRWNPKQGRNSPLWDVHLSAWTDEAIAQGLNLRQTDWNALQGLVDHGFITAPGGDRFQASGFIVNCPIISSDN